MVERTWDLAELKRLVTDPSIFPHVSDDYYSDPKTWEPPQSDDIVYLVAKDSEGLYGFGVFIAHTRSCFEAHLGFLRRAYGPAAHQAFQEMLQWIWERTTAARIVGEICADNKLAIKFAQNCGFTQYGINPKSRLRGGVLQDQVCLGISRP